MASPVKFEWSAPDNSTTFKLTTQKRNDASLNMSAQQLEGNIDFVLA
jgi:hypothetical protein